MGGIYIGSIMQLPQFWCLFVVSNKWTEHCKNKHVAFIQIHEFGFSKKVLLTKLCFSHNCPPAGMGRQVSQIFHRGQGDGVRL